MLLASPASSCRLHAFQSEQPPFRVLETMRKDFLVFGRLVPTVKTSGVGKFEDDDDLWFRPTFDELGVGAGTTHQVAPAVLGNSVADCGHIWLQSLPVGDLRVPNYVVCHSLPPHKRSGYVHDNRTMAARRRCSVIRACLRG